LKRAVRWYNWIILSIIVQFLGLLYINNFILNTDKEVSISNVDTKSNIVTGDFKIPEETEKFSMSYNGQYCAYLVDGKLHIMDVDKQLNNSSVVDTGKDKITYFRWLPDRNMVILSSNTKKGKKGSVQISTYEADSKTMRGLPTIDGLSSKSEVLDIDFSQLTNIVYAQIKTSNDLSKIIRFNVMNQYASVMTLASDTKIKETTYVNKLFYNDPGKSIYYYDGSTKTKHSVKVGNGNTLLLNVDADDNVYIGQLDSNKKITKIFYQKVSEQSLTSNWKEVNLKDGALPQDVLISDNGNIYINYRDENKVINAVSGLKASYRGEFVELLDGALVSVDKNKVDVITLKEY
jgi:DNA-dependent RNA polymerase auxiliary subunit epsilon